MKLRISDKLKSLPTIDYRKLVDLQGELKDLNKKNYARLLKSLKEKGFRFPFVVWNDVNEDKWYTIDGNQRHRVFQKENVTDESGLYDFPMQEVEAKDKAEAKEMILLYSSQYGTVTQDGWDTFTFGLDEKWLKETVHFDGLFEGDAIEDEPELQDAEPQIDRAAELNEKWQVISGDLWTIGEHRLLCGDSTKSEDVERVMGVEKADCVFTSPPYGVGVDYGESYDDNIENLRAMLPKLSKLWLSVLVAGGFAVVNFGDIVSAADIVGTIGPCEYPMAVEYWPIFRADGWRLWSRRIWCKPGAETRSMQCISSNRAATNWEHIWTWMKDGPSMFTSQTTGKYPSQNGWFDSSHDEGLAVGLKDHGAGMPPLPAMFSISNHSREGGVVHEPFCGTGTTMVACQNLNRKCCGIEISPDYCAVILERMHETFPELDIKKAVNG